ncbi:O-acyltransferase like protein-like [Diadema antillarum]|uniref:O-acyltransferase like protein-like n=1 Tax=Diadema antillarum TaxID=105358 RepID=UPI003A879183
MAVGQLNPHAEKFFSSIPKAQDGYETMSALKQHFAENGMDYDSVAELMSDDARFVEFMTNGLRDVVKKAKIQVSPTGDRSYILDGETGPLGVVSARCIDDNLQYLSDIRNNVPYARRMYRSRGQLPSEKSLYTLGFQDFGDSWLCESNKENKTSGVPAFDGQYCYSYIYAYGFPMVGWGICTPSTCTQDEIQAVYAIWWFVLGARESMFVVSECNSPNSQPWRDWDIAFLSIMAFMVALVMVGSSYEFFFHKRVLKNKVLRAPIKGAEENIYEETMDEKKMVDSSVDDPEAIKHAAEVKNGGMVNGGFQHDEKNLSHKPASLGVAERGEVQEKKPKVNLGWAILDGILMSFSALTNLPKMLSAKKSSSTLAALNGIRVLSMWWVILGHTCQFYYGYFANPLQTYEIAYSFGFLAITNSTFSVDTFFVLSGFLVTFFTLKAIDSKKLQSTFSWGVFYFHRWWRLTPVYMAAMGIFVLLMPHFAEGPHNEGFHDYMRNACVNVWWTHPLYINNFYPWPYDLNIACMGWTWYLANDMQFFIISPIILVILYKSRKAGLALITSLMAVSLSSLAALTWYYGYTYNPYGTQPPYNDNLGDNPLKDTTYAKPYTRIPTYLVGMVTGYILFSLRNKRVKMSIVIAILGWLCALGTLFGVIYGVWGGTSRYIEQWESVLYLTLSRVSWGVGVAWMIFACLTGYGGFIGVFLEWGFWVPLAKMSYCAYLIHPVIIFSGVVFDKTLYHFSYMSLSYTYVGNIVFSYVSAAILSLVVEAPTMCLEKVMFGKFKTS